eukprot:jgi/Tetstr1/466638/TSEL_011126.t1
MKAQGRSRSNQGLPGFAARLREQQTNNFRVDACSSHPVARRHRFVLCVVEGARLGEHLRALLKELAEHCVASCLWKQPASWHELRPAALVTGYGGCFTHRGERHTQDVGRHAHAQRQGAKGGGLAGGYRLRIPLPQLAASRNAKHSLLVAAADGMDELSAGLEGQDS